MEKFQKYQITPKIDSINHNQAKVTISPLEKGFGLTIGNALRRIMLSAIPGSAVFAVKIHGVTHEFQSISGVKEDTTQIILNLKSLILSIDENLYPDEELATLSIEKWPVLKINVKGEGVIKAGNIELPSGFTIINKDLHIATITNDSTKLNMEIYATRGRGFKTFAQNRDLVNTMSLISIDSNFSPIVRIGYAVEEQKISKNLISDCLILDVTTNGAVSPENAIAIASKILVEHLKPLINISEVIENLKVINEEIEAKKTAVLSTPIEELNLSVRSYNCLKRSGIQTIQELANMTKNEVEHIKNLGRKSFREIQKQLANSGLTFKEEGI